MIELDHRQKNETVKHQTKKIRTNNTNTILFCQLQKNSPQNKTRVQL